MEENKIRIEKKKKKVSKWCDRIELLGKGGGTSQAGRKGKTRKEDDLHPLLCFSSLLRLLLVFLSLSRSERESSQEAKLIREGI
jgi:hypothetical protein